MSGLTVRRGQPLIVLGVVLGGWLVVRAMLWSSPLAGFAQQRTSLGESVASTAPSLRSVSPAQGDVSPGPVRIGGRSGEGLYPAGFPLAYRYAVSMATRGEVPAIAPVSSAILPSAPIRQESLPSAGAVLSAIDTAALPLMTPGEIAREKRWRVDGWILWREGSGLAGSPSTSRIPGYGRSQAGAIIRYRLGEGGARDPFLFARANRALVEDGETEAGVGFGVRPVRGVPVTLQGELRITATPSSTMVRPAVMAVTEFPPVRLTELTEAEAYIQGGYIGGDFGTAFVDGQARVERRLARPRGADIRLGAGAWGGAQEGAARLDVGPTASVRFEVGEVPIRASVDYRVRVAGVAEPGSGVAVTIVSGF